MALEVQYPPNRSIDESGGLRGSKSDGDLFKLWKTEEKSQMQQQQPYVVGKEAADAERNVKTEDYDSDSDYGWIGDIVRPPLTKEYLSELRDELLSVDLFKQIQVPDPWKIDIRDFFRGVHPWDIDFYMPNDEDKDEGLQNYQEDLDAADMDELAKMFDEPPYNNKS